MAIEARIVPFREFLDSVRGTDPEAFVALEKTVANAEAVRRMRAYILDRYKGLEARYSFVDANGSVVDCIVFRRQPLLRGTREDVARATALRFSESAYETDSRTDLPEGTIPVRRLTLEEMAKFEDIQQFLSQTSGTATRRPPEVTPSGIGMHRWAYAFQSVANIASSISGVRPTTQRWSS
jgi:hypothetical protein